MFCEIKIALLLLCTIGLNYGAQNTGFPSGFLAKCPGINKKTILSKETKRSLHVVVLRPSSGWFGSLLATNEAKCKLSVSGADCVSKHIDLNKDKVVVFISGYLDASFSLISRNLVSPYLNQGRAVIIVECFPLLLKTYPLAARLTKPIGFLLGEFLANLTRRGLSPRRMHILGGSLGAHIGSYAAMKYHELTNWKPYRLTGLDPAGPCFRDLPPWDRFNAQAAYKVDALHTNIDSYGIADTVAQVDFYANGGENQARTLGDILLPCLALCSHVRAASYWIAANNNPDKFLAVRCDSVGQARHGNCYGGEIVSNALGATTNFSRPGIYYLPTKNDSPYFLGEKGLSDRKYGIENYLLEIAHDGELVI